MTVSTEGKVHNMVEQAAKTIAQRGLAKPDAPVLLMVSGGSDSVALAYIACELRNRGIVGTVGMMHVNHNLRGMASDEDAQFVQQLADALGLPLFLYSIDVRRLVEMSGDNLEAVARHERYSAADDALEKLCRYAGEPLSRGRIFTAHTRNDRVENFYMRSIVGTGPGGFRSMLYQNGSVSRPLLDADRDQLRDYLRRRSMDADADETVVCVRDAQGNLWREDATNAHTDQFRGYVRNEIVPLALARNPRLLETLCRTMNLIADEDDMLSAQAQEIVERCVRWLDESPVGVWHTEERAYPVRAQMENGSTTQSYLMDRRAFRRNAPEPTDYSVGCEVKPAFAMEPVPLQRRAIVLVLQMMLDPDARVETRSVEVVLAAFAEGKPVSGYTCNIQGNLALSANRHGLRIEPMEAYRLRRKKV